MKATEFLDLLELMTRTLSRHMSHEETTKILKQIERIRLQKRCYGNMPSDRQRRALAAIPDYNWYVPKQLAFFIGQDVSRIYQLLYDLQNKGLLEAKREGVTSSYRKRKPANV